MIDTILFDLDGTLLPMDFDHFMKLYFYHIGEYFSDLIEPKKLIGDILQATDYMARMKNDKTNEENFMEHFAGLIDGDIDVYKNRFNDFYINHFDFVQASTSPSSLMNQCVKILKEKGYTLCIATNPLFPRVANLRRLKWGNIDIDDFLYMSTFEQNKYNKPFIEYFQEVLDHIVKRPEDCLMVGNDLSDDLPAQKIGIKTYIITDHLLNKNNVENTADYIGDYQAFYDFVVTLPNVK